MKRSIEINKSFLYDQINSEEHRDMEDYFIMQCMTFCERCSREIKTDEWRKHIGSEEHLKREGATFCSICQVSYYTSKNGLYLNERGSNHQDSDVHKINKLRLGYSLVFYILLLQSIKWIFLLLLWQLNQKN